MGKKLLYKDIFDELVTKINSGELKAGNKLPTVRELTQTFNVSHLTILRVLKDLSENGFILPHGTTGYFVAERGNYVFQKRVLAAFLRPVLSGIHDSYGNRIYAGIENQAFINGYTLLRPPESRLLLQLKLTAKEEETVLRKALDIQDAVDGIFLDERISDDALQPFLKDFTKTIVIVNRATKLPVIAMPPPNSALMTKIMEYGVQLGYEVFIFATSNTFFNNFLERKNAFDAFVKEHKLEEDILEGALIHTPDLVKERLMQCMKRHKGRRILFVCPGDYVGRAVADYLQQMGYEFKKEVGVVSIEGLDFAMERKPLLTTVAFSPQMLGEMAVSKMLHSIARIDRRSEPDNESIPFTMQFGDTM